MTTERRITDPQALKALAHPLRRQLYRLLAQTGPATVGQLVTRLPLDPGLASYHLRQLARWGYIEEVPELAKDRRERWWRVPVGSLGWSFLDFREPEGRAAATTVKAQMIAEEFERVQVFEKTRESWPESWQEAAASSDSYLRLNPAELSELNRDLLDVIRRWSAKGRSESTDDAEAREPVFLFFHAFPERP
jgi:DNA-binding transcriptional ArsR family regulator